MHHALQGADYDYQPWPMDILSDMFNRVFDWWRDLWNEYSGRDPR